MRSSTAIFAVAILAVSGPAWAQSPAADVAVSTAPAEGAGAPLSTRQQIDQYLASSPAAGSDREGGVDAERERRIRGEVSVGVGTGGYRSGSVSAVIPLGETGTLALGYSRTENGYGYGDVGHGQPGYGYGYDGLSQPLTLDANCGAGQRARGWYGQPAPVGRAQASAEDCERR